MKHHPKHRLPYFFDFGIAVPYIVIPCDQRALLYESLSYEQPVKGIVMIQRQSLYFLAMLYTDGQDVNTHLLTFVGKL